jgi:hypothetical protein
VYSNKDDEKHYYLVLSSIRKEVSYFFAVTDRERAHLSGKNTGARRPQIYNNIHNQLETTLIHMAASDRPMHTL